MSNLVPSQGHGSGGLATIARSRELGRVARATDREVAIAHARAHVIAERGRANTRAVQNVATDAMQAATSIARHSAVLGMSCPSAEPMIRGIVESAGLALTEIVAETARDLR